MIHYFVSYIRTDRLLDMSNYKTTTIKVCDSINKEFILENIQLQLDELGEKEYPIEKYKVFNVNKL